MQNMEDWESVETLEPTTQTTIVGLDPQNMYAFRVAAKSVDGRYGNLSDLVTTQSDPGIQQQPVPILICLVIYMFLFVE